VSGRNQSPSASALVADTVLLPWVAVLARDLPADHQAHHWRLTCVGFDSALVAGFIAIDTGGLGRSGWLPGAAVATATAL
jgi:hypothetical protein